MPDDKCKAGNVLIMGPPVDERGTRACLRHLPDHRVGVGTVRPLRDGQPINGGEVVALKHIEGDEYAVESLYGSQQPAEDSEPSHAGPAKVTTDAYRSGWDRIFGAPREIGQA